MSPEFNFHLRIILPNSKSAFDFRDQLKKLGNIEDVTVTMTVEPELSVAVEPNKEVVITRDDVAIVVPETSPEGEPTITFGAKFRQMREALGLSQPGLAERVEMDQSHIGKIERGVNKPPKVGNIYRLAKELHLSPKLTADLLNLSGRLKHPITPEEAKEIMTQMYQPKSNAF